MRQVLHILRMDCRQFWQEILGSLLVTAMFVWVSRTGGFRRMIRAENATRLFDLHPLQILANLITGLLPFSWFLITTQNIPRGRDVLFEAETKLTW